MSAHPHACVCPTCGDRHAATTARAQYVARCHERGIPVIQVSPKVLRECKGFGKLPTFPKPSGKRVAALYASRRVAA